MFGLGRNEKLRDCDELKQNMVNLCASVYTPVTVPTWGHISQMAKKIRGPKGHEVSLKLIIGALIRNYCSIRSMSTYP